MVTERLQTPLLAYVSNKLYHVISVWTYLTASYYQTGSNAVDVSSKAEYPNYYVFGPLSKWFILYLKRNFQQHQQDNPEIFDKNKNVYGSEDEEGTIVRLLKRIHAE